MRSNKVFDALSIKPLTSDELPYRPKRSYMGMSIMGAIKMLKVSRRQTKGSGQHGSFRIVYYIGDDIERAIVKFVRVNFDVISRINLAKNNQLHSGLPKGIGKLVISEFKRQRGD